MGSGLCKFGIGSGASGCGVNTPGAGGGADGGLSATKSAGPGCVVGFAKWLKQVEEPAVVDFHLLY